MKPGSLSIEIMIPTISLTPFCVLFTLKLVFQSNIHRNKKGWITQGIEISCEHKRTLYVYSRNSNDAIVKVFYIKYCKILNKFMQEAKKQHYNKFIVKLIIK
jgi:ribosomal protein L33